MEFAQTQLYEERVAQMWRDYTRGQEYLLSRGISREIPRCVRFFEGDQWPAPTERTRNLPRPVVNIVKMICRSKAAGILSTKVNIVFKSACGEVDVTPLNELMRTVTEEMEQEALDRRAVSEATVKGTYVYHYYWDSAAREQDGRVGGGLRCELIDPLRLAFSDPCEPDEQKQKWIIVSTLAEPEVVRAVADPEVNPLLILPDSADGTGEGNRFCTVLTRYFRVDGEVFCERAVGKILLNRPFPLCPAPEGKEKAGKVRARLYPLVVGQYEPREHSIYGISEAEGLIANQKAINFLLAMQILNVQQNAWSKYLVLPGALGGQVITNEPGQVLTDHSRTGNGIRRMESGDVGEAPLTLVDTIASLTRTASGTTEVMTGEILKSGMSGAAIAELQSQAQQPIETLKNAFWQVKVRQGRVIAQFFRLFYTDKKYIHTDGDGRRGQLSFNSAEWLDAAFEVTVEAVAGTRSSAAGDIAVLDSLLASGRITPEVYLRAYPADALSNREELLRSLSAQNRTGG